MNPIVETTELSKRFEVGGGLFSEKNYVHAVDEVSLSIRRGETFGLVGESGCGKSTLGRLLIRLLDSSGGAVLFDGIDLSSVSNSDMRALRKRMQIVQQNPYAAIDPRMRIVDVVAEPLLTHGVAGRSGARSKAIDLLEQVGLSSRYASRFPHQLSGGQLQRVAVARAISLEPELIILDEPTSALDVSVQAQILGLLESLQAELDLTYVFISHDLSVIRYVSDTIAVMYLGRIVESGPSQLVFESPQHPYTKALLEAAPEPDFASRKSLVVLEGNVPSALHPPSGCHFHERCPIAQPMCATTSPVLEISGSDRSVACHFPIGAAQIRELTLNPEHRDEDSNE